MAIEKPKPSSGDVFNTTDGEKIRIDYDRVYIYKSDKKNTTVELGWAPDTKVYMLDIPFEEFDAKLNANKKAWEDYWANHRYNDY